MSTKNSKKVISTEKKHVNSEVIYNVLHGAYGDGAERNKKLKEEGYSPSAVTKKINDLKKIAEELQAIKDKAGDYYGCLFCLVDVK